MANQIQHTYGTAAPASDALAKSEIAVRHIAANCTASSSSMIYVGEDAADDGVTARALGTGISGDSGQGGAAIGGNITFTGGTDITTSVSGSTVTITSSAGGGSGDMTGVDISVGTGLDISQSNTTSGSYTSTITLDLSEFTDGTSDIDSNDEVIYLDNGTEKRKAFSELKLSEFNNDSGWTSNSGDITGVTAGTGLSGGGSSGGVTLALDFSELTDMTGGISGSTEFILQDGSTESRKAASEIALSNFNNDSGWTTNSGTVTSVGISPGTGLDAGSAITSSGTISVSLDLSELTDGTSDIDSNDEVIYLDNGTEKRKAFSELKLSEFNNDSGWTSNSGDITGVTAGDGLTGGGSSGSVTLTLGVDDSTIEISSDAARVKASGITTSHLAADAVTGAKIADDAIDSEHYTNASIDHAHLANDCVDGDNIANDSIDSEHYVDGSIDHAHLANDCIDGDNIQNDVINSEHYAAGSIDEEHLNATNSPSDNQILSYNAAGSNFTWVDDQTGGGGSGTTINNNANNYIITGSGTADTLEAESTFTFDAGALVLSERSPTITMGTSHPSAAPQIKMYEGTTLKSGSSTNITVATEWAYDAMSGAVMAIGSTEYDFAGGVYMGAI